MSDLTPMFYFLAAISMDAFLIVTAIVLVLLSLLMMTTKFVKLLR